MSVTGVALILFLTFHMSMNVVALFSGEAYNAVCEFLGANWYALVATLALAALALCVLCYAGEWRINRWTYGIEASTMQAASAPSRKPRYSSPCRMESFRKSWVG